MVLTNSATRTPYISGHMCYAPSSIWSVHVKNGGLSVPRECDLDRRSSRPQDILGRKRIFLGQWFQLAARDASQVMERVPEAIHSAYHTSQAADSDTLNGGDGDRVVGQRAVCPTRMQLGQAFSLFSRYPRWKNQIPRAIVPIRSKRRVIGNGSRSRSRPFDLQWILSCRCPDTLNGNAEDRAWKICVPNLDVVSGFGSISHMISDATVVSCLFPSRSLSRPSRVISLRKFLTSLYLRLT
jgi:hypothetical protein